MATRGLAATKPGTALGGRSRSQMNNNLTTLNQNFISLIDSTENIVSELKNVNSTLMTNNLLQAFTAFQAWRIKQKL